MFKRPSFIIVIIVVLVVFGLGILRAVVSRQAAEQAQQLQVAPSSEAVELTVEEELGAIDLGDLDAEFENIDQDINQL